MLNLFTAFMGALGKFIAPIIAYYKGKSDQKLESVKNVKKAKDAENRASDNSNISDKLRDRYDV